jgi:hypothetical protein
MNLEETARVLAKAQAFDRRTIGEADIRAWHEALSDVDYTDALQAVTAHYRDTTDWLMPAHIRALAARAVHERHRLEREQLEAQQARELAAAAVRTEDRSDQVADLVAGLRAQLPEGDARKLHPRAHYWRQRQRGNRTPEANPLYQVPPPGGHPVPGEEEPSSLQTAITDTFASGWPDSEATSREGHSQ